MDCWGKHRYVAEEGQIKIKSKIMITIKTGNGLFQAEDFVDFVDDGGGFVFGELAVGVPELGEFGARGEAGIAIFLESQRFAADAGEGVDEADVFLWLFEQGLFERFRGKGIDG